jgi:hypothetical protein
MDGRAEAGEFRNIAYGLTGLLVLAVLCTVLILFAVPGTARGPWGLSPQGAQFFKEVLSPTRILRPLPESVFAWGLRALIVAMWACWTAIVALGFRGAMASKRATIGLVAVLAIALAVVCPPVLSSDALAYVAYGRIPFVLHLNPYEYGRAALEAAGDPSADFLRWPTPLPYGPLWTLAATAVAAIGPFGGLFGQVLAHKLIAAFGLIAAALGGARLAEGREPGRGTLTLLAIGLNPLLLLEGPGSGHNDIVMLALLVWGGVVYAKDRGRLAAVLVGLAIAVKPVALIVVPLLAISTWVKGDRPRRLTDAVWAVSLSLVPVLLLSFLFGGPYQVAECVFARFAPIHGPLARAIGLGFAVAAVVSGVRVSRSGALAAAWLAGWIPVSAAVILLDGRRSPVCRVAVVAASLHGMSATVFTVASTLGVLLTLLYAAAV